MTFVAGTRLASYEILGPLGKGGMGEVYRARDTRLQREVALKLLPDELLCDRDRIVRFEREAKVLAALNHRHIATIYGVVEYNTSLALAMELVDGPTLAERLDAGALPIEETLPIATQIAEALEYAHERGVIHRDLKPANIKFTNDGNVKVLDFGLAKVLDFGLAAGSGTEQPAPDLLSSPTLTVIGTRAGTILGTAAYMSPEQARGKAVDRRTDVWAFGCVLYEMLTGSRPFSGETTADTLAAIVRAEPEWSRLPAGVPARVRDLLQRCLRKEPRLRLQSVGDARVLLEEIGSRPEGSFLEQGVPAPLRTTPLWRIVLPWALAGLLAVAAVVLLLGWPQRNESFQPMAATLVSAPELDDPVISPDGRAVVYVREKHLWVRRLDALEPHSLDGTDGARAPFWSSDSSAIGYFRDTELRIISAAGGVSRVLWQLPPNQAFGGGAWSGDRIIVDVIWPNALYELPASGGAAKEIAKPDAAKGELMLSWPKFLPDGKTLVMTVRRVGPGMLLDTLAVQQGSDRRVILHIPGSVLFYIGFSPTTGDLLFEQAKAPNDGIWAVPFSPSKLQTTGTPTLVQANGANASVSRNGTLVYLNGLSRDSELVWVDRAGKILQHIGTPEQDMREPAVAPDGVHVAVDGKSYGELLVQDANRNTAVKINFGAGDIGSPQWSPDGKTLAFIIRRKGGRSLAVAFPDNSRTVHEIPIPAGVGAFTFTRDGKNLLIECKPDETWGICKMALQDGAVPEKLIFRPGDAARPQLSPDGHFLAYQSDESGRWEIYVQPFPTGQGRWQISTAGGVLPKWNPNGKELAYLDGQKLMVVPVETKSAFVPGLPRALFSGETLRTTMQLYGSPLYDYSADGQKFVIARAVTSDMLDIIAIQNLLRGKKPAP